MRSLIPSLGVVVSLLLFTACGSYKLGRPGAELPNRFHILPVSNRAELPQARPVLTEALREAFARNGGWQQVEPESADAWLRVTLLQFERNTAATSSRDTGRSISFETRVVAEVTVVDPQTGIHLKPPFEVSAQGVALIDPSLPDSEYQNLPALFTDLARQIHDRLAYDWD